MLRYFAKRILLLFPMLLAVLLAVFLLLSVTNPDGFSRFRIFSAGYEQGEADLLDRVFAGTDAQPNLMTRYLRYCYDLILHGDFGDDGGAFSISYEIFYRLRLSLVLAGLGLIVSLLIGLPLGFTAALHAGKTPDRLVSLGSLLLASIPSYTLAVLCMVVFTLQLRLLPMTGLDTWKAYVMPTIVISAAGVAMTVKMTRSAVLDTVKRPYIKVLKAKGISNRDIVFKHVLKNASITIASTTGNLAAQLICGTLIAENFFSVPGIGQLVFRSISKGEQRVVLGTIAVLSVLLMGVNILADLLCALISPRIRAGYAKGGRGK